VARHTCQFLKTWVQNHIVFKLGREELFKTSKSRSSESLVEIASINCLFNGSLVQSVEADHAFQGPYLAYRSFQRLAVEFKRPSCGTGSEMLFRLGCIVCVVLRRDPSIELPFPFNSDNHIVPSESSDIVATELLFDKVYEELWLIFQPLAEDGIAVFQNQFGEIQGSLIC